jgi:hypothetical protein
MSDNVINEHQLQYFPALCDALKSNIMILRSRNQANVQPPDEVFNYHEVEALVSARELFDEIGEMLGIRVEQPVKRTRGTRK